jgi:hypothetical protein
MAIMVSLDHSERRKGVNISGKNKTLGKRPAMAWLQRGASSNPPV